MPILFDIPLFPMAFCVTDTSQIIHGILSHPIRIINILVVYYNASAYCGPFVLTSDMIVAIIISMFLPQLFVSILIGFLFIKAFPLQENANNNTRQTFYLASFFAIIIFLIIRLVKNHFASPLALTWGGDPLVLLTPQFTLPQAILNATLYGPSALIDRADSQTASLAVNISIAIDSIVSIIGGYVIMTIFRKMSKHPSKK